MSKHIARIWAGTLVVVTMLVIALLIDDNVAHQKIDTPSVTEIVVQETTTTTTTVEPTTTTTIPHATQAYLECVRWIESRGDYTVVSPSGTFMGAYQFYQVTWDVFARKIGRNDLVGVQPNKAAPVDQDKVAVAAYNELGSQPWNGACR